ncbi:radical SAM family heme chaperone HemW [Peptostreptococcus faecalis]|uniref:radical SAM family heme chaperone HemW n=1 Tax=Peptostreptococcus faecalis TaxID=2045015 RepID=UPI000C7B197A|nr:radical SAM family heme chaperone HemW [Peptostreptococcus faecalis]
MKEKGVYIHIPFCVSKCQYCDFTSYVSNIEQIDKYLVYLEKEIEKYNIKKEEIKTIFIGGGTPTILNEKQLIKLMDIVKNNINLENVSEYTVESNPGTLDIEKLTIMKENGVNRISIGLQAKQKNHLDFMGRIHSLEDFEDSYKNAREVGFKNINVDLIFAFSGQSEDDWKETLEYVVKLDPEHISTYSLIIEEETPFFEMLNRGEIEETTDENYLNMYRYTVKYLESHGLNQYEISNFSEEGYECKHNLFYWEGNEYFGFGCSSSGYLNGERYTNIKNLSQYYEKIDFDEYPIDFIEKLTDIDRFNEYIMLGLRKNEGIQLDEIREYLDKNQYRDIVGKIQDLSERQYVNFNNENRISLTQTGREVSNSIITELMI